MDIAAPAFSSDWERAWNSHDVEAMLAHFHDDVVFTSPVAAQLVIEGHGAYLVAGAPPRPEQ